MDKKEYLVRTFSRTKRKDYENYILNAIWQQMNYPQIRPVSQQYVKSGPNEYYLIDLYFPQLNVGVEVDEAYHLNNTQQDMIRTLDISRKLSAVPQTDDFKIFRVDATLSARALHHRIKEVANEIAQLARKMNIQSWDTDVSIKNQLQEKGYISVEDYYQFDRIIDFANDVFLKKYRGYQQASFPITVDNKLYLAWSPVISTSETTEHSDWYNTLNDNWTEIKEVNTRNDGKLITVEENEVRCVFAKMRNPFGRMKYRYIGNFQLVSRTEDYIERIYRKVGERIYIDYDREIISFEPIKTVQLQELNL